eukprot:7813910-Pyramimonas_sp.AAC.1
MPSALRGPSLACKKPQRPPAFDFRVRAQLEHDDYSSFLRVLFGNRHPRSFVPRASAGTVVEQRKKP